MAFLAAIPWWVPAAISAAGTIFSAVSQARAGSEQQEALNRQSRIAEANAARQAAAAEFQAKQLEQIAQEERGAASKAAAEERRRSRVVQSRALALAAAGGGGATDPTVVNIISDLAGEGEYLAALRIYEGEESARKALTGAEAARYEGASGLASAADVASGLRAEGVARRRAGMTGAAATIFAGAGRSLSMYGRYGRMETPGLVDYS